MTGSQPRGAAADTGDEARQRSLERRILFWMCVLIAVNQLGFGAIIPTLPLYAQSFGVSASAIGLAIAVYGLARFAAALPAGNVADRFGRRPALALGGFVSALGNIWCAVAVGYPEFIVARFVAGLGAGIVLTVGQVVLADISTPERRGRMISIYQGTFIFAVGIGPLPGGLLAEYVSLAAPFWAYGIAAFGACAVAWFAVEETRDFSDTSGAASAGPPPPFSTQLRLMTAQIGFLLVSLVSLMNAVVRTGGLFNIVPVLATATLGISVAQIGFALAVGSVSGLLAAYPAGWLTDRFGRKAVIVPATVLAGASMLLFGLAPSYPWFLAAAVVWGVAISAGGSAPAAYAADSAPPRMNAAAMSTFRMVGDLGYVIGPIALGLIVDLHGAMTGLVVGAGLLVAVGLLFLAFAPETYRRGR